MEGLGEFLRKGREKAGVTLDELAQRTRIRVENLESLERGDLDNLPSDAYVRGFVRQVCREVGLSSNEALVRYDMLRARSGPPDEITWSEDRTEEPHGRLERALEDPERVVRLARRGGRWMGLVALGAVAVLVAALAWRAVRGSGEGAPEAAEGSVATAAPREEAPPPPRPEAPVRKEPALGAASETVASLATPVPTPVPAPRPDPVAPEPRRTPPPERAAAAGAPLRLEIVASRPVEVSVLLDGRGQPRSATLAAGERRAWRADDHFVLTVSDGDAVRLHLDGRDLGPAGPAGREVLRTLSRGTGR